MRARITLGSNGWVAVLGCLLVAEMIGDARGFREKDRLIRSVVRQQQTVLANAYGNFPADWSTLEGWLASEIADGVSPAEIKGTLQGIRMLEPGLTEIMRKRIGRWILGLERWAREEPITQVKGVADEALRRGRTRYFEAKGYAEIGRTADATILFLWAGSWLTRYIQMDSGAHELPEALYLLGDAFMRLRNGMPPEFRGERLLRVCSDLYPSSIWADRANAVLRLGNRVESGDSTK